MLHGLCLSTINRQSLDIGVAMSLTQKKIVPSFKRLPIDVKNENQKFPRTMQRKPSLS